MKKNAIDFQVMRPVVIGIIFGSFLGAVFAIQIAGPFTENNNRVVCTICGNSNDF